MNPIEIEESVRSLKMMGLETHGNPKPMIPRPSGSDQRLVRLSRYQKMPDDGCGEWIGAPNNGGDVGDMSDIVGELNGLLIALHDAINRPKGVVPESAERFYQANAKVQP